MTKSQIIDNIRKRLKPNQKIVSIEYKQNGEDELGIPSYEIAYKNPPKNFRLERMIEPLKIAILEDLDYKEIKEEVEDEATS